MGKDLKKNIRFVMTVGDKEKILEELEKRSKNPTVKENREELEKSFPEFKSKFEKYDNSDVYEQYMINKTGKYLIYCIDYAHMSEMLRQARQIFSKVNSNISITYMGKGLNPEAKKSLIRSFEEDSGKPGALNLLFINKATMENFYVNGVDGVVLLYSSKRTSIENDKMVNQALDCCLDNGVIIQTVNNIDSMGKFPTLKKMLEEEDKFDIQFFETESFEHAKQYRKATYSRRIDEKYKLKLMQEYKKETGKNVSVGKVFKGYYIGSWKNNLRQKDANNQLNIETELRKEFEREGILGDRQRRERTSDLEKYNLLMKFVKENPEEKLKIETVDKEGNPIGKYRAWLQTKFNANEAELTKKQISDLRKNGLLYLPAEEANKISKEFNIPEGKVNILLREFGSIERFIIAYKTGKTDNKGMKLNKKGIILSSSELSIQQKQKYINLMEDVFGKDCLDDVSKFVIEDDIIEAIEKLDPKRKMIVERRFGLNGFDSRIFLDIAKELGVSRQLINEKMVIARRKLANSIKIYSINDLIQEREDLQKKLHQIKDTNLEDWKKEKLNYSVGFLKLTPKSVGRLNEVGYETVGDLLNITKEELENLPGFGYKKITQLLKMVEKINGSLTANKKEEEDKKRTERINLRLKTVNEKIEGYKKAYSFYIESESVTSQDGIILPTIDKNSKSRLENKKEEKQKKQEKINSLEENIRVQNEKTDKLHEILGIEEEIIKKEEN